jgi:hypothetical protein
VDSAVRTPAQTAAARFWSQTSLNGFTGALRTTLAPRGSHAAAVERSSSGDRSARSGLPWREWIRCHTRPTDDLPGRGCAAFGYRTGSRIAPPAPVKKGVETVAGKREHGFVSAGDQPEAYLWSDLPNIFTERTEST